MNITVTLRRSRSGEKYYYMLEWGKDPGQRRASGIFYYAHPASDIELQHNIEAARQIEVRKAQMILDMLAIGTGVPPQYRFYANFLDFYEDYVRRNKRYESRHLQNGLQLFRQFIGSHYLAPIDVTEELCFRFRRYLLDRLNGETPASYFTRFKHAVTDLHHI